MPPFIYYTFIGSAFMASLALLLFFVWIIVIFMVADKYVNKDPYLQEVDKLISKAKKYSAADTIVQEDRFKKLSSELEQMAKEMEGASKEFEREVNKILGKNGTIKKNNKAPK